MWIMFSNCYHYNIILQYLNLYACSLHLKKSNIMPIRHNIYIQNQCIIFDLSTISKFKLEYLFFGNITIKKSAIFICKSKNMPKCRKKTLWRQFSGKIWRHQNSAGSEQKFHICAARWGAELGFHNL